MGVVLHGISRSCTSSGPSSCWIGRRSNSGSRRRRSRSSSISRKGSSMSSSSRGFRGSISRRRRRSRMRSTRRGSSSYARICVCTHVGARADEKESTTHGRMPKRVPTHGSGGEASEDRPARSHRAARFGGPRLLRRHYVHTLRRPPELLPRPSGLPTSASSRTAAAVSCGAAPDREPDAAERLKHLLLLIPLRSGGAPH